MDWQERAAIREYDGGLSRPEADVGALWGAIVDSEPGRWRNVRHDDTARRPHMKSKFIAAALALSSFAMFGSPAVAQQWVGLNPAQLHELQHDSHYDELAFDYEKERRGAEQGDAHAQFRLGRIYRKGVGVPQNDAEAVKWFRLAAEQGHPYAQQALGTMYLYGQGVPKNDAEAEKWLRLAGVIGPR